MLYLSVGSTFPDLSPCQNLESLTLDRVRVWSLQDQVSMAYNFVTFVGFIGLSSLLEIHLPLLKKITLRVPPMKTETPNWIIGPISRDAFEETLSRLANHCKLPHLEIEINGYKDDVPVEKYYSVLRTALSHAHQAEDGRRQRSCWHGMFSIQIFNDLNAL